MIDSVWSWPLCKNENGNGHSPNEFAVGSKGLAQWVVPTPPPAAVPHTARALATAKLAELAPTVVVDGLQGAQKLLPTQASFPEKPAAACLVMLLLLPPPPQLPSSEAADIGLQEDS
mmetsp:Transcript_41364/g.81707  ORF Transcript_41364/g.81707 Transcript_41364/m.81707 type:complete len:117 (-) Transcript_41364:503-853(-)